jgi:hypothetical protein
MSFFKKIFGNTKKIKASKSSDRALRIECLLGGMCLTDFRSAFPLSYSVPNISFQSTRFTS